jgi:hypothetical protein
MTECSCRFGAVNPKAKMIPKLILKARIKPTIFRARRTGKCYNIVILIATPSSYWNLLHLSHLRFSQDRCIQMTKCIFSSESVSPQPLSGSMAKLISGRNCMSEPGPQEPYRDIFETYCRSVARCSAGPSQVHFPSYMKKIARTPWNKCKKYMVMRLTTKWQAVSLRRQITKK